MPTTAGLGWVNCPESVAVKEDTAGVSVTEAGDETVDLILEASCSAGSTCGEMRYSFDAGWDFTLEPLVFFNFEDVAQSGEDQTPNGYDAQLVNSATYSSSTYRYGDYSLLIDNGLSNGLLVDDSTGLSLSGGEITFAFYMKPDSWSGSDTDAEYHVLAWFGTDGGNDLRVFWYAGVLTVRVIIKDESGFGDDTEEEITLTGS